MTDFTIRKAAVADAPQVVELIGEFAAFEKLEREFRITESDLTEVVFGAKAFVYLLVAASENRLSGFALLYPKFASFRGERSLYLEDLYVRQNERGKGLGLALLKAAAKFAQANGFRRLDWQALKWNTSAIEFYRKIGAESDDGNVNFRLIGKNFKDLAS